MNKTVSVIVPCYNQGKYLSEAINSVIHQTYNDWECIIVNDGSTEEIDEIIKVLVERDKRISYHHKANGGLASARNYGIELATGNFILPLDADDKIHESYLEKGVQAFDDSDIKIAYCDAEYFGAKKGKLILPGYSREGLAKMNMIFCSALFKKKDFLLAGGYNTNMKFGWEDWNLWISILKHGGKVDKIPEVLFYYRIKEESMLLNLEGSRQQMMYMQLYLNHPDFFEKYYGQPVEIVPEFIKLQTLLRRVNLIKGLVTFQSSSYRHLIKKVSKQRG